jgi:hypothetical protein
VLNFIDVASEFARVHGNWLGARFALGFILGTAAALLVSLSLADRQARTQDYAS